MTEAWKEGQLQWIARQHEVRRRELDSTIPFEEFPEPAASQIALVQIFSDMLDEKTSPRTTAKDLSDWVISVSESDICYDIDTAYGHTIGVILQSAIQISSLTHQKLLAELVAELANLPDAVNTTGRPIKVRDAPGLHIQPGEVIELPCVTGGRLWSGLPFFTMDLQDYIYNGPAVFLQRVESGLSEHDRVIRQKELKCLAEQRYNNINTFAALIARSGPPQGSSLSCCLKLAFAAVPFLEFPQDSERGKYQHLAVRAIASWLVIAGEEVVRMGSSPMSFDRIPGSLWEAAGGTNVVDRRRLEFWKERFQALDISGRFVSSETYHAVEEAINAIDRLKVV